MVFTSDYQDGGQAVMGSGDMDHGLIVIAPGGQDGF